MTRKWWMAYIIIWYLLHDSRFSELFESIFSSSNSRPLRKAAAFTGSSRFPRSHVKYRFKCGLGSNRSLKMNYSFAYHSSDFTSQHLVSKNRNHSFIFSPIQILHNWHNPHTHMAFILIIRLNFISHVGFFTIQRCGQLLLGISSICL